MCGLCTRRGGCACKAGPRVRSRVYIARGLCAVRCGLPVLLDSCAAGRCHMPWIQRGKVRRGAFRIASHHFF